MQATLATLRTYELVRRGHFDAAHHLPDYPGACGNLHGHRWEVIVTIYFHSVDISILKDENSDGMLVDFADLSRAWEDLDHSDLNDVLCNPTAECVSNWILERVAYIVQSQVPELSFHATVQLWESPDSGCTCSLYSLAPEEQTEPETAGEATWTDGLRAVLEREGVLQ